MTHAAFALYAVYSRRRLKMSIGEALQLILGFAAPILLVSHVLGTRAAMQLYGTEDTYAYVLLALWGRQPDGRPATSCGNDYLVGTCLYRSLLLAASQAMVHAHSALALWRGAARPGTRVAGLLSLPVALWNDWLLKTPGFGLISPSTTNAPEAAQIAYLYQLESWIFMGMAAAIALTLLARALRLYLESREGVVRDHLSRRPDRLGPAGHDHSRSQSAQRHSPCRCLWWPWPVFHMPRSGQRPDRQPPGPG